MSWVCWYPGFTIVGHFGDVLEDFFILAPRAGWEGTLGVAWGAGKDDESGDGTPGVWTRNSHR